MREPEILDLEELELEDGPSVAAMVDELRRRAAAGARIILRNCPQMLAHTLYKAGILARKEIELESYREEEPYG